MTTVNYDGTSGFEIEDVLSQVAPFQMTLKKSISLTGVGLHSGGETTVVVSPAPENTGIVFSDGVQAIPGLASYVVDTSRGTTIGHKGASVRTIEHIMAALRGRGVDNAIVEINGPETPALDGSALAYIEAIDAAGLVELDAVRKPIVLTEPVWVQGDDSFILAVPAPHLRLTYVMNYDHPLIGAQTATYVLNESDFGTEIAPARTFALYEEVAALLENRLAQGGSIDNAIVLWHDRTSSELRFVDELIRHKLLDLVGDLALVGGLLQADVVAVKSGHMLNVEFAKEVNRVMSGSLLTKAS